MSESAKEGHESNLAKIEDHSEKIAKVQAATFEWLESFMKTPIGRFVGAQAIVLLGIAIAWITAAIKTPTPVLVPPPGNNPPIINVISGGAEVQPHIPPIIEPPAANGKVVLHLIAAAKDVPTSDLLKGLTFQIDPKVYRDGSTYPFGGKSIPLPCMTRWSDGRVIEVQPFAKAEDVVSFVKKGVAP